MFGFNKKKRYCRLQYGLQCTAENNGLCTSSEVCEWQGFAPKYIPPPTPEFGYQPKNSGKPPEPPSSGSNAVKANHATVIHAHWIDTGHYNWHGDAVFRCSNCQREREANVFEENYCCYCGAKMDEEV